MCPVSDLELLQPELCCLADAYKINIYYQDFSFVLCNYYIMFYQPFFSKFNPKPVIEHAVMLLTIFVHRR